MSPEILFQAHLVLGYVAWLLCFGVCIWPRLKAMDHTCRTQEYMPNGWKRCRMISDKARPARYRLPAISTSENCWRSNAALLLP
jgi:hypothetical protein